MIQEILQHKSKKVLLFAIVSLLSVVTISAQNNTWQQKASIPGSVRYLATGFSIGSKGYIGTGFDGTNILQDLWEFDPVTNTWTQKANIPDSRAAAVSFSIGNKGYVCTGSADDLGAISRNDLWEFDPAMNTWTRKADFPGIARQVATGFSIGIKGYVGVGRNASFELYQDFWEYDPSNNSWTRKADYPGGPTYAAVGFGLANKGYIGTGVGYPLYSFKKDFWEYNPATDAWTQKADFGGTARELAVGFSVGYKGYIGTGSGTSDLWEYNPATNNWIQKANFTGGGRNMATGFAIGSKGYIGTGAIFHLQNDLWEYTPSPDVYYFDTDGDGYGHPLLSILAIVPPPGYVNNNSDCNDFNANAYPGAPETQNSIDDNCDGQVDEGLITTNQFIYLKGNATEFAIGSYGTQRVASVGNNPGKRRYQTTWQYNGKMYLFGGEGNASNNGTPPPGGYMNDVWEYDPTTNNWRWLKGTSTLGGAAVYGTKGIAAATNTPGARKNGMGWVLNNKFYLFGGYNGGRLCDLWEFDPSTNNWTWIAGNNSSNSAGVYGTLGVADAANLPAGREQASTWTYNGKLYLFGGIRSDGVNDVTMNDLWEYNFSTGYWTWINGSNLTNQFGVYGSMGVASASNIPGSRYESGFASIGSKVYIFGGTGRGASPSGGVLNDVWEYDNSTGLWIWLHGSTTNDAPKVTGTQGTYAAGNTPGARSGSVMSSDNSSVYLYGGFTWFLPGGFHSDLWQYNPATNQWRSVKGNATTGTLGTYGFENVEASSNLPGARGQQSLVTIGTALYMFGGRGYSGISSASDEHQNDLWKFNTSNNNWTWLKGASGKQYFGEYGTKGFATPPNKPGSKVAASSIGANGKFYLFGGSGNNNYPNGGTSNELWEYEPVSGNWKWLKGSNTAGAAGNYGTKGVSSFNNEPPFRTNAMMWSIGNKIYMFGGTVGANYNDLWEYDITTFNWTWLKGSNTYNQSGVYGTKGVAASTNTPGARWQASAFTYNNKLYLFGGNGLNSGTTSGELNDLWEYDPATNNWTWLSGNDAINSFGIYGTINVAAPANLPGGRETGQMHTIGTKAYLFGGRGFASVGGFQNLNDTWEYDFATNQWTWKKGLSTGGNAGVAGSYGIEDPANYPIARYHATSWALSNKLYVFSGTPFGPEYNDLWEYNPTTNNWRYIKGRGNLGNTPANYGLQGVSHHNNLPSIRWQSTAAVAGGSAYIFGGIGGFANATWPNSGTYMNDLWKWVPGPVFLYGNERKLYVNDNNLSNDIYTTAIGNNNNSGTPSAPLATLDFAVSVAQPGDTIFVDAGTYVTPNFSIGKALTILGPNYTIPVNDVNNMLLYNTSRNAEAIINNSTITIGASNVNIEGLQFEPLTKTQILLSGSSFDFNNIKILRNRFMISSTAFVINISGRNITPLSSNTYFIVGNRFEKTGGASGTTLTLNFVNVAYVSGNVFTVANSGLAYLQSAISNGSTGKVDNLNITGNIFDRLNGAISTGRVGTTLIDDNKCYDSRIGFALSNVIAEPATITVTRNVFTNVQINGAIFYSRSGANDISSPNKFICEDNAINFDATGQKMISGFAIGSNVLTTVLNANIETTIKRNRINISGDFTASPNFSLLGLRIAGRHTNILIDSNEINISGTSIPQSLATGSTGVLVFTNANGAGGGQIPANAVINILHNKINGFKQSVTFNNVQTGQFGGLINSINNINYNSFTGDSISVNNGTTSQTINANCNWYGTTASQNIFAKITPSTVNHTPWLTDGTDADLSTIGFQPAAGTCNGSPVVITLDNANDITCFGADNGSINVSISGGTAPYNIEWTKDEDPLFTSGNEDLSNLAPGTYTLTVTDANGSISSLEVTINEPELLIASADGTNNICFGASEGTAYVTAFGGTSPYTYLWSNGATTENVSGLAAGIYSVSVTDANGCTTVSQYEVTEPAQIVPVITNTSTTCTNIASVNATGGTGGYTYLWSNGATTASISNVQAGTYSVEVTDENDCTVTAQITLIANEGFNPSASVTDVNCFGGNDGSITITNVNGDAPFQYSIDGGFNYQSSNVFTNLAAATYTITVVDANGCTGFVTKIISQPTELVAVLNNVQSTCFGQSTGSISVSVSGGSPAYSYSWTGPGGFTSSQLNISNLIAGDYELTITDNNGCIKILEAVVTNYPQILFTSVVTNIACKGTLTGSINLSLDGGTESGFAYLWSGPNGYSATTEDLSGLGVGNFNVVVTDIGSGCTVSGNFTITQPATTVNISTAKTNATGCNSLGTITATGSGGTPSYQYSIDGTNYQASQIFTGLYAGSYTVWVKDANGCTKSAVVSITDNGSDQFEGNNSKNQSKTINISVDTSARLALATDVADWFKFTPSIGGSYTVTVNHPSVSYTFNLYPAGNNAPALVPVSTTGNSKEYVLNGATTYYLSVTTATLSYVCYRISITNTSQLITSAVKTEENKKSVEPVNSLIASVFPNPHKGRFNIVIDSPEEGNGLIQMISADGKLISSRNIILRKGKGNIVEFNNINQHILFYRVLIKQKSVTGKIIGPN